MKERVDEKEKRKKEMLERERESEHKNSGGRLLHLSTCKKHILKSCSKYIHVAASEYFLRLRSIWRISECFHMVDPRWATQIRSHKLAHASMKLHTDVLF